MYEGLQLDLVLTVLCGKDFHPANVQFWGKKFALTVVLGMCAKLQVYICT